MSALTRSLSRLAHSFPDLKCGKHIVKLSEIGVLYDRHLSFFNDGFVELACLLAASFFTYFFSRLGFAEFGLVFLNLAIATPITFSLKYLAHREWVWKR